MIRIALIVVIAVCHSFATAQPSNYYMNPTFGSDGTFTLDSPVIGIETKTTQATSSGTDFYIEWDSEYNEWYNTSIDLNSEMVLTFEGQSRLNHTSVLNTATTIGNYYITQIEGLAYSDRNAVIMETENAPISFASSSPVTQSPTTVYPNQNVEITVTLSGDKSTQEKAFVRYTTDGFSTSDVSQVSFSTSTSSFGTATIPASINSAGTTVEYYVYTTTVDATSSSNHDLITLNLANNSGSNYSYTVENSWATSGGGTNWSDVNSWDAGEVPPLDVPITIDDPLNLDQKATVSSLNITSGNNFTINTDQTLSISGELSGGSGSLAVNGNLEILGGGFTSVDPLYATTGNLIYNSGGSYAQSQEWPSTNGPKKVIIKSSDVTLLGARSTTDLRVRGGSLDCNSNDLTIGGDGLVVANASISSSGSLVISDGASLIDSASTTNPGGSITGDITVKRSATEYDNAFNYWSTPVNGAAYSDVWTFGTNAGQFLANDLYKWDNNSGTQDWINPTTSNAMTPGEGFILTGPIDGGSNTRTFTGPPNNGDISVDVIVNGTGAQDDDDYNLLGNPYPSAIDADAFYNDNSSKITGTFWFWDVDITKDTFVSADYATYTQGGGVGSNPHGPNPDQYISSCQGFFVEADGSSGTNTVTFSNSHRMQDNNSQFFKSAPVERMWLTAMSAQGHGNKMLVGFSPLTTDDYDAGWDGKKLKGNQHIAFYSKIGKEDYAIQILSRLHQNKSVPLGLDAGNPGTYTISIDSIDGIPNDIDILLENTSTGNYYDLRENDYTLSVDEAKTVDNLVLHFRTQSTGIDLEQEEPLVNIWQSGSNLIVKDLDNAPLKNIRVVDINGRTIRHISEPASSLTQFGVSDWPAGIYLVEVTSSEDAQTQKIFIK